MNQIEMKKISKGVNWIIYEWYIDGQCLSQYLHNNLIVALPENIEPFDDLCPAWTKGLDFYSDEWCQWIGENWDKELFRRRINYTKVEYENPENVLWFSEPNWTFDRNQYENMLDNYWTEETIDEILCYSKCKISFDDCVKLISRISRKGSDNLNDHKKAYGGVLLHIYASDEIGNPLYESLKKNEDNKYIYILSGVTELMWKYGEDDVKNVVDVTILEHLSDDEKVWNQFGDYISKEFLEYINTDLIKNNIAICGVKPITKR